MRRGHLFAHLTTIGTTVVRPGPGVFHAIVINRRGSNNSRVVIRDDAAIIADMNTGGNAVSEPMPVRYDAFFRTNLTVQRIGSTAPDITILFRANH